MTLTRITGKVFGGNAPLEECGVFGSAKLNSPTNSIDVATIQSGAAYEQGWGAGVVTDKNFPPIEEVTGVLKTISYQTCYLLQEGIPSYDAGTAYSSTSIVKNFSGNTLEFYKSLEDENIGNPLNGDKWIKALIVGEREIGIPQITLNPNTLPDNCIWLEGGIVSRTDYATLFSIYGTTYGAGDGSTTFQLPDFRERYFCGVNKNAETTMGYISAALPNLQLSTSSNGAHTHTRGTMDIQGEFLDLISHDTQTMGNASGAFATQSRDNNAVHAMSGGATGSTRDGISFKASRNWTGATSSNGAHTHTITSSNSIIGASNTVKTNGIRLRVYTRYQ